MANIPQVNIAFSNGNLLQNIIAVDGYAGMVGTGLQVNNLGKVVIVNNLAEAEQNGLTALLEPYAHRHIKEFYQELAGDMRLYIMLFPISVPMAEMLDTTDPAAANKLIKAAGGDIRLLGVWKQPLPDHDGGDSFFDEDVEDTLIASKAFCEYWGAKNFFFRVAIEGRIADEEAIASIIEPRTYSNGYACVLTGSTLTDGSASVGLLLGRRVKYACHIKIGKVANGTVNATALYIGTRLISDDGSDTIDAVAETKATATLTITNVGNDNRTIWLWAITPNGYIFLGQYTKVIGDATVTAVATAIAAAINAGTATHAYTAASALGVVTITNPAGLGSSSNGYGLHVSLSIDSTLAYSKTAFAGGVNAIAEQVFSTDIFHDKGFISFVSYANKAGYFFGIDQMASTDDYRLLVYGGVVDATAVIANQVYTEDLEGEVDTNPDGTIQELYASHLEDRISLAVNTVLGERISGFQALVDRTVNIINTGKCKVKLRVRPKGYLTFIEVDLGLTAGNE